VILKLFKRRAQKVPPFNFCFPSATVTAVHQGRGCVGCRKAGLKQWSRAVPAQADTSWVFLHHYRVHLGFRLMIIFESLLTTFKVVNIFQDSSKNCLSIIKPPKLNWVCLNLWCTLYMHTRVSSSSRSVPLLHLLWYPTPGPTYMFVKTENFYGTMLVGTWAFISVNLHLSQN